MKELIKFFTEVNKLKRLKRKGWVLRKVENPESVADHTFSLALQAWILGREKGLNIERILKMALIHDLCEVFNGDITPYDSVLSKDENELTALMETWPRLSNSKKKKMAVDKRKSESQALERLIKDLSPGLKKEIRDIWLEFEQGLSGEAKFIRQLDKVVNLLQALRYRQEDKDFPIGPWWIETTEKIDDPFLIEFVKALDKSFPFFQED